MSSRQKVHIGDGLFSSELLSTIQPPRPSWELELLAIKQRYDALMNRGVLVSCLAFLLTSVCYPQSSAQDSKPSSDIWWKHAVIYEIYPRSFQDSNGDGLGDLNGITLRLDYLRDLGIDAIWISPMYPSPLVDFGYDVSDYTAIDPLYGTLADFDRLVSEGKKRNIRVIMDFVPNH